MRRGSSAARPRTDQGTSETGLRRQHTDRCACPGRAPQGFRHSSAEPLGTPHTSPMHFCPLTAQAIVPSLDRAGDIRGRIDRGSERPPHPFSRERLDISRCVSDPKQSWTRDRRAATRKQRRPSPAGGRPCVEGRESALREDSVNDLGRCAAGLRSDRGTHRERATLIENKPDIPFFADDHMQISRQDLKRDVIEHRTDPHEGARRYHGPGGIERSSEPGGIDHHTSTNSRALTSRPQSESEPSALVFASDSSGSGTPLILRRHHRGGRPWAKIRTGLDGFGHKRGVQCSARQGHVPIEFYGRMRAATAQTQSRERNRPEVFREFS